MQQRNQPPAAYSEQLRGQLYRFLQESYFTSTFDGKNFYHVEFV